MPSAIRVLHVIGADRRAAGRVEAWLRDSHVEFMNIDNVYALVAHSFERSGVAEERPPALVLVNASRLSLTERGIGPIVRQLWPEAHCVLYDGERPESAHFDAEARNSSEIVAVDRLLTRSAASLIQERLQSPPHTGEAVGEAFAPANMETLEDRAPDRADAPPAMARPAQPAPRARPLGAGELTPQELARLMGEV
ncbi:MAG: hypothetical protein IPM64_14810 [Phycisphaerales bacterium]|nr:hypothetical protein [Phycisphaerales bacterium]